MNCAQSIGKKIYKALIEPKGFDEDTRRREFIVNVVLVGSIALASFLFLSASVNAIDLGKKYEGIPLTFLAIVIFGFSLIHLLSRKGHPHCAAYLVIASYLGGAVYETATWSFELPESTMPYTLVIIMACILVGTRFGFFITGVIASILIGSAFLQQTGILHPDLAWKTDPTDVSDSIEQSVIYLIITLVSWLSAREIEKSLIRARKSEEALRRERDDLEQTLAQRTRELRRAQAVKMADVYRFVEFGKLASGIFHDLMSPLTSVTLSIEELQEKESPALSKAVLASKSIQNYMKALRRQISAHERKEDFMPSLIIEDVILLFDFKAREHGTKITFTPDSSLRKTILFGNPLKFQQILINLISNALYACVDSALRDIRITLWEENNALKLSVSDSGCGMSVTELEHIFEPFFTTKPESEGSGLGLSITKTIIEHDFKGTLAVATAPGKGSVFTITFPHYSPLP